MENYNVERVYKELMIYICKNINDVNLCHQNNFYVIPVENLKQYKRINKILSVLAEDNEQLKYKQIKNTSEHTLRDDKKLIAHTLKFFNINTADISYYFNIRKFLLDIIIIKYEKSTLDELILDTPIKKTRRL